MRIRLLDRIPLLLATYPLCWLALFYGFVLRARLALGYWPAPYLPDPKDLGFTVHHMAVLFGLVAVPAVLLAAFASALIGPRETVHRRLWPVLALIVVSAGVWLLVVSQDPGQFFVWFGD